MGNNSGKSSEQKANLSHDDLAIISNTFKTIGKNSSHVKADDVLKLCPTGTEPRFSRFLTNYLFGPQGSRAPSIDFNKFAELYAFVVNGTVDEKMTVLLKSIGQSENSAEVAYPLIEEYVESIVGTYLEVQKLKSEASTKSWERGKFESHKENVQKLAENLTSDLIVAGSKTVGRDDIEKWLQQNSTLLRMLQVVFAHLYHTKTSVASLLPVAEGTECLAKHGKLLDQSQILFVNSNLPIALQCKWRFLFSSQIHGESFSTFLGKVLNKGPTVIIVEDENGYMFGGFAPASWSLSPNFVGDENSFIFTLKPKMKCFQTTGYNDHYQYLNLHQQTMPNGLGMGGQFGYWGLWLDSEYGLGECSESCTTFRNYEQLSATKKFKFRHVEVWAVGEEPKEDEDDGATGGRSILDGNLEDKVLLELAGKRMHSDGLREEPDPM